MQGGVSIRFSLFGDSGQLILQGVALLYLSLQSQVHDRQLFGRILHFSFNGLAFFDGVFNPGLRVALSDFLLESSIDRRQFLGGLHHKVLDLLALV